MRFLIIASTSLLTSGALAHDGPHMHPHGGESILAMAVVATLVAGATWVVARRLS